MTKLFDLIFFARPMLLVPVCTVYLHYLAVNGTAGYINLFPGSRLGIHLAMLSMVFAGTYVINQIFDVESDRANRKLHFLPQEIISMSTAWIYYAILTSVGMLLATITEPNTFIIGSALVMLGILYSVPGVRLKDRPIAGLLANAVAYGLCIPSLAALSHPDATVFPAAFPYMFAIASGYVLTTIPDREGDAATGKRTVAVAVGRTGALRVALILVIITAVLSLWQTNYEMAITALITLVGVVRLIISFNVKWLLMTSKFPILILTLFAAAHFPLYLIFLLLTSVLTRIYYKRRFGIVYPKLG